MTLLFIISALLGLAAVAFGAFPRRRGDAPFCARCGYNLTGLTSPACPECGAPVGETGVVIGQRYRRPGWIVAGVPLLLLSAAWLAGPLRDVDWYRYAPATWVLRDLRSTTPALAQKAWAELERRATGGRLSGEHRLALLDVCLDEQAARTSPLRKEMMDHLADAWQALAFTPAQRQRFEQQVVKVSHLEVRPQVVLGDPVPFRVVIQGAAPYQLFWGRTRTPRVLLDGRVIRDESRGSSHSSGLVNDLAGSTGSSIACDQPGPHELAVEVKVELFTGTAHDEAHSRKCGEQLVTVKAPFEVLAEEPPDYIRLIRDPSMRPAIQAAATPGQFSLELDSTRRVRGWGWSSSPGWSGRLPVDVAFKAYARLDTGEREVARFTGRKGSSGSWQWLDHEPMPALPDKITFILRPDPAYPRTTVDMYEIWDGEIELKDVRMKIETP